MASNSPFSRSLKRFKRNKPGVLGLIVIILAVVVAILGYSITPDQTPDANDQVLELASHTPGFTIQMLKVKKNRNVDQNGFFMTMLFGRENPYELKPITGYVVEGNQVVASIYQGEKRKTVEKAIDIVDLLYALDPSKEVEWNGEAATITLASGTIVTTSLSEMQALLPDQIDSRSFLLGTDNFGRDMLSRTLIGVRISLSVGAIAVIISIFIGVILGAMAGYFRGIVDDIIMWFINVIWAIPTLLLAFALTIILGKGFWQIFIAVGLSMWVDAARLIRGQVMGLRESQFVEAAKSLGYSNFRIIVLHVIPNITGPLIVIAAANFASAILVEAGLSYLGIGVQPPAPSWGSMLSENYGFIISGKPFMALVPGVAIMILVMAFNLVGNAFRDALDVRTDL